MVWNFAILVTLDELQLEIRHSLEKNLNTSDDVPFGDGWL